MGAGLTSAAPMLAALAHGSAAFVWTGTGAAVLALAPAGARWLRVAQREHYIADSCSRFALRWWRSEPVNLALVLVALAGVVLSGLWPLVALAPAAVAVVGPVHLSIRGRTSPLVWTRRLRVLAAVWLVLQAAIVAVGAAVGAPAPFAAAGLVASPAVLDVALLVTAPVERRLSERFVRAAGERLRRVAPTIVAITGSYGKTSTKNHVAQLVTGSRSIVATPASFNNRGGLARAVNEHLAEGTEVFVAEMGTYGPGEIRDLCRWCPPTVAVLTAIGPVHLERFGTEEAIVAAKREITERASVVIVNADDPRLAALARALDETPGGPAVVRCSTEDESADVCMHETGGTATLVLAGQLVGEGIVLQPGLQPGNVACAIAVALQVGVDPADVVRRLPTIPVVANRLTAATAPSGVYVVDDTFNSNPAGARAALALLTAAPVSGRRVVVTPGMIELGRRQRPENEAFARAVAEAATDLVVVGQTNRRALVAGASAVSEGSPAGTEGSPAGTDGSPAGTDGSAGGTDTSAGGTDTGRRFSVTTVRTRPEAVEWVRASLGPGDAVLYENDLPDHYP